jgi:hypothetical protein
MMAQKLAAGPMMARPASRRCVVVRAGATDTQEKIRIGINGEPGPRSAARQITPRQLRAAARPGHRAAGPACTRLGP